MPKSQHPYFVCAETAQADQRMLDGLPYEEHPHPQQEQEQQEQPTIYYYVQAYRWNVMQQTPNAAPWIGLNLMYSILIQIHNLSNDDSNPDNNNNTFDNNQRMLQLQHQLINRVSGIFLDSFRILLPVNAHQWQNIVWDYDCRPNGLYVTSQDLSHHISFHWDIEERNIEGERLQMTVITVEYTGPFQLEEIPQ